MGLLNGMIGQTILVVPLLGVRIGYVSVILLGVFFSLMSGYTASLIVAHLGKAKTITEAILDHFDQNQRYAMIYNGFIGLTFLGPVVVYFSLLVFQF